MEPQLVLLRNADVYAPARVGGRSDLLIGGGKILALLRDSDPDYSSTLLNLPSSLLNIVDLRGARVIPGLIDAHVHVTGGGGESGPASRVPRLMLSALTRAGVTTCVGVLGTDGTTRTVSALVAETLALREEGLSAWCWTGSYEVPPITLTGGVRSDIVFVDPILGVGEVAISDHRSSQPTFDEIARLAADCHVAGMMSGKAGVLHLHVGDGPRGLDLVRRLLDDTELPASVFFPTHVNRKKKLWAEAIELARRGCPIDVTAFPVGEHEEDVLSASDAIRAYLDSGAPLDRLTCSSDGGGCLPTFDTTGRLVTMDVGRPSALHETLVALLGQGIALESILPVMTSNVAAALLLTQKGRIAAGADADLVVLSDETHEIRDVMARGRFVVRAGRPTVHGTFEPQQQQQQRVDKDAGEG